MQMQLPIFPTGTKLINSTLGVRKDSEIVYYLHAGSPIGCHDVNDLQSFRYTCGSLVSNGLCNATELAHALGVSNRSQGSLSTKFKVQYIHYF